jgi:hypothetical protein
MFYAAPSLSLFPLKLAVTEEGYTALFNSTASFKKPPAQQTQSPFASGDLLLYRPHDTGCAERKQNRVIRMRERSSHNFIFTNPARGKAY